MQCRCATVQFRDRIMGRHIEENLMSSYEFSCQISARLKKTTYETVCLMQRTCKILFDFKIPSNRIKSFVVLNMISVCYNEIRLSNCPSLLWVLPTQFVWVKHVLIGVTESISEWITHTDDVFINAVLGSGMIQSWASSLPLSGTLLSRPVNHILKLKRLSVQAHIKINMISKWKQI